MLLSVIIPVYHEAEIINETLGFLLGLPRKAALEIIVVDGDPQGSTIKAIHPSEVMKMISAKGRARQMNYGASRAAGDILIFLHADTILPRQGLMRIQNVMEDTRYVAGAFNLGIRSDRSIFRITERYAALRTRLTGIPFGDQAIFMRKEYFEKMDGYRDLPLMEDVDLMKRIRKRGGRICLVSDKVLTSARRWEEEGILFCTFRNLALQMSYALGVSPERLAKWYRQ